MNAHYWRAKMVTNGPWIGVMTWYGPPLIDGEELDRSPRWQAKVRIERTGRAILMGGHIPTEIERLDTDREPITLRNIQPIEQEAWEYLIAHAAWATQHAPHMPDASPRSKIDRRGKSIW